MRHACFSRRFRGFRLLRDILCGLLCGSPCASLRTGGCALCLPPMLPGAQAATLPQPQGQPFMAQALRVRIGHVPALSRAAKSGGMLSTSKAFSASTISAICRGEVSVAARTNTPVPSIRASSSVDAALRL